jgi:hypothetical protein
MVPLLLLAAAASTAVPALGAVRSRPEPRASAAAGSRLQVIEVEYRLTLSRGSVKAGAVGLEAIDRGMDPHDLRLRRLATRRAIAVPQLTSGKRWNGVLHLAPGTYELWCSLPEHAKLGMHATLRAVR